jgi:antitoxin component YwqK of YwqJK toxin-antitoxin module
MKHFLMITILLAPIFLISLQRIDLNNELVNIDDIYFTKDTTQKYTGLVQYTSDYGIKFTGKLLDGKKDSTWNTWHDNGQKRSELFYVNGVREGEYRGWFDDGSKMFINHYENGKLNGENIHWDSFGNKEMYLYYIDGKPDGRCIFWNENRERKITYYRNGLKSGKEISYYKNGIKKSENNYVDDIRHGEWLDWNEKGQRILEANWVKGKLEGFAIYYVNEEIISIIVYKNGEAINLLNQDKSTFKKIYGK